MSNVRWISYYRLQGRHYLPSPQAHVSPSAEFSRYMGYLKYSSWLPISLTYAVLFPWSPLLAVCNQAWAFLRSCGGIGHLLPVTCSLSCSLRITVHRWFHNMGIRPAAFLPLGSWHRSEGSMWRCVEHTEEPTGRESFGFLIGQTPGMQRHKHGSLPDLTLGRTDSWPLQSVRKAS